MKIKVTQEHIQFGMRRSRYHCPIALAVKEQTGVLLCCVDGHETTVREGGLMDGVWHSIRLPEIARQFVTDFDFLKDVEPFEFELPWEPNS